MKKVKGFITVRTTDKVEVRLSVQHIIEYRLCKNAIHTVIYYDRKRQGSIYEMNVSVYETVEEIDNLINQSI